MRTQLQISTQTGVLTHYLQDVAAAKEHALPDLLAQYDRVGTWAARHGTALALQSCAASFEGEDLGQTLNFLMSRGVIEGDEEIRSRMLDAGKQSTWWLPENLFPSLPALSCSQYWGLIQAC